MRTFKLLLALASALPLASSAITNQKYKWRNVKIGGGGGFTSGIVFNPTEKGLAYARTDIGGVYKLNADDSWTPLLDFADSPRWNYWGVDAVATDPVEPKRLYLATGLYTNSWDGNGQILISSDYGKTFTPSPLPFKIGGNMPGRGLGERLAVDPHANNIIYFGARSGNGLWKSTDYGATWSQVASFTAVGTYVIDPNDGSGYNSDIIGIAFVTFDSTSGTQGQATPRIFVGVGNVGGETIYFSEDAGETWSAVPGQPTTFLPHKGILSPAEKTLYISYSKGAGPNDGDSLGEVWKYNITGSQWTNISPAYASGDCTHGFGGLSVDIKAPGTVMVAALNCWWPDGQIFRSTDSGATWSKFWTWKGYPVVNKYYSYSDSLAPWLGINYTDTGVDNKQLGWWIEALAIDPHDSNHWLYGTGATIYGGHDLKNWDTNHNVTLTSLADGIEEEAIQDLTSPPVGPPLLSAIADVTGFVHKDLDRAPKVTASGSSWQSGQGVDYAGNKPNIFVRTSNGGGQIYTSQDAGETWTQYAGATDSGSKVAISADGNIILWRTGSGSIQVSKDGAPFTAVPSLPSGSVIASDKRDNNIFYGGSGGKVYQSIDGGKTFSYKGTLGSATSTVDIAVNPYVASDVWFSTEHGLWHTSDLKSYQGLGGVTQAWSISLGAPKTAGGYASLYALAKINNVEGVYRSDDKGINWSRINDANFGFGSLGADTIAADSRTYGRLYIGTNGRGIFYGDIA